jgi:hypothetical protein
MDYRYERLRSSICSKRELKLFIAYLKYTCSARQLSALWNARGRPENKAVNSMRFENGRVATPGPKGRGEIHDLARRAPDIAACGGRQRHTLRSAMGFWAMAPFRSSAGF